MAAFTVPSSQVYVDTVSGHRYYYRANDVIDLETAVRLSMPGATEPDAAAPFSDEQLAYLAENVGTGGGASTIHNYCPDGAVASDDLIDTANAYDPQASFFIAAQGTETLALSVGTGPGGANEIAVTCPGSSFREGIILGFNDSSARFPLPAGHWNCGATIRLADNTVYLDVSPTAPASHFLRQWLDTSSGQVANGTDTIRLVADILTIATDYVALSIRASQAHYGVDAFAGTFYVSHIMFTEGEAYLFADGDSDGWSWLGTPHASASSGPQP